MIITLMIPFFIFFIVGTFFCPGSLFWKFPRSFFKKMDEEKVIFLFRSMNRYFQGFFLPYHICLMRISSREWANYFAYQTFSKAIPLTNFAMKMGDFAVADWCLRHNYELDRTLLSSFCRDNPTEEIFQKKVLLTCFPFHPTLSEYCAQQNNFKLLQWAEEKQYPIDPIKIWKHAANNGNLNLLQFGKKLGAAQNLKWLPFDFCGDAARQGHLEALQFFIGEKFTGKNICSNAAAGGHLHILEWALQNGYQWDKGTPILAAKNGHFEILKWMFLKKGCSLHGTCEIAAEIGNFEMLKWAHQNNGNLSSQVCSSAAVQGRLDILQWSREKNCPWDSSVVYLAGKNGHFDLMFWAIENGCERKYTKSSLYIFGDIFQFAASKGTLGTVKMCHQKGILPQNDHSIEQSFYSVALKGDLATFKYMHQEMGLKWVDSVISPAIEGGNIDLIKYLEEHSCPLPFDFCDKAAASGHLPVLEWGKKKGFKLTTCTFENGALGGNLEILQWLKAYGCPWNSLTRAAALKKGHRTILWWLRENGCP
jgi:hypothetical protein